MKNLNWINYMAVLLLLISSISCNQTKNKKNKHESAKEIDKLDGASLDVKWTHPLIKMGRLNSPLVEVQPFNLNGEFYLLECWRSRWDWPGQPNESAGKNDEMWIAYLPNGPEDYEGRKYISVALRGNTLGTAIVWKERVYVFGVNEESGRQYVEMTWSEDLEKWSEPVKVFNSPKGEIFNVSLTRDDNGFVFLWETNGLGKTFTMCFGRIDSLSDNWNDHIIESAVYGEHKYTGGPEVIFENGWYYLLYLEALKPGWETRITRSKNLIDWEDAPLDRPFIPFNKHHKNLPLHDSNVEEINASDPGTTVYGDEVIVYFTGGIQQRAGDLQWAKYHGTVNELMTSFFTNTD